MNAKGDILVMGYGNVKNIKISSLNPKGKLNVMGQK